MREVEKIERMVVVLSGGQDSTTCLFWALAEGVKFIHCVTFDYNQRHAREIQAAKKVVDIARQTYPDRTIQHEIVVLGPVLQGTSPLVSGEKLEQYESHESLPGGLEKTFVPMRNQLFLTIAANRAYVHKCPALVTGVCEEDFGGYPDCRQSFIYKLQAACNEGTFTGRDGAEPALSIYTPLMRLTKADSVYAAMDLPGCYKALAYSHTSYDGQYPPTGHDHATLLREKGFQVAGIPDPLVLRAFKEGLMAFPSWTFDMGADEINKYLNLADLPSLDMSWIPKE